MTRVGWTLIHFLWQGVAIAVLSWALASVWREARARYVTLCGGLLAMALVPFVTFALLTDEPLTGISTLPMSELLARSALSSLDPSPAGVAAVPWLAAIVWMWAAGVMAFSMRLAGGWMLTANMVKSARPAGAPWPEMAQRASHRLGFAGALRILSSPRIDVPLVAGYFRPVILFPAAALAHLSSEQIEAILAHEVAHILRRDPAVNLLQSVVEAVLFYHPAVWWISNRIRAERENCCDDLAASCSSAPTAYAKALLALEESRSQVEAFGLSVRGSDLRARVARLLTPMRDTPRSPLPALLAIATLAAVAAISARTLTAQKAPQPAVVAQRPNPEAHPAPIALPPMKISVTPVLAPSGQNSPSVKPELAAPYKKWLEEDAVYIINTQEWRAFEALTSDAERDHFIAQFWERRNPNPGSSENAFKKEHYRRIAYANERFGRTEPGWKTERGRYYIAFGPPDEIESHPFEGIEQWLYHQVGDVKNILISIDTERNKPGRLQELKDRLTTLRQELKQANAFDAQQLQGQIDRIERVLVH